MTVLKKRGLGRGLDALLGDIAVAPEVSSDQLQTLPIELLQRGRYQPRKDINPEKLQDLANSIRSQGVVQPLVVRKIDAERYEIVAGERRWRAAQMVGLAEIPVVVRDIDDRSAMAIALIENIQREELNPLDEAEGLRRLVDEFGMTHQQVADVLGRSRAAITNLLRLLDLQSEVKQLLLNRQLEMGHARALLALQGQQQVAVGNKIAANGMTVRAAEKLIKVIQEGSPVRVAAPVDLDTLRLQEQLTSTFGAKVRIAHKDNGKGNITISYTSLDELDGIVARLK